jgi:hypothetical protein
MRSFRPALIGLALAGIAIAGSSSAVLAATEKSSTDDAWTFIDGSTRYENVVSVDAKVQVKADGSAFLTLVATTRTETYENDVLVSVVDRVERSKSAYVDDAQVSTTVKVKQGMDDERGRCSFRAFLRIVDFEVVKDRESEVICR